MVVCNVGDGVARCFGLRILPGKKTTAFVFTPSDMTQEKHHPAIWFPGWADALQRERLPALVRQQYRMALIAYLRFCKQSRQRVTVGSARAFMEQIEEDG